MKNNLARLPHYNEDTPPIKMSKPCVILSMEAYEDLMEELELARSKDLPKRLADAMKRYDSGSATPLKALEKKLGKVQSRR